MQFSTKFTLKFVCYNALYSLYSFKNNELRRDWKVSKRDVKNFLEAFSDKSKGSGEYMKNQRKSNEI